MKLKASPEDRKIAKLASQITSQPVLDAVLNDVNPQTARYAVYQKLLPHLGFTPDCPECGLRRGAGIPHPCQPEFECAEKVD